MTWRLAPLAFAFVVVVAVVVVVVFVVVVVVVSSCMWSRVVAKGRGLAERRIATVPRRAKRIKE